MKIFLVLNIFFLCVFNYSVIAKEERVKGTGVVGVSLYLEVDEFTKAKAYKIIVSLSELCELRIYPSKMIVNDEGDLIERGFMTLYHERGGMAEKVKIMIDGNLQKVSGDGWEKKLISEMKKGKEIIVRGYVGSIDKTVTSRAKLFSPSIPLNKFRKIEAKHHFAECWNEIPEEYIFFSDKDQKKEPEAKVVDDLKMAKRVEVASLDWGNFGKFLDSTPRLLNRPSTKYPSALLERGIRSGTVRISGLLSTTGEFECGPVYGDHPELKKMATSFMSQARFSIPKRKGKPFEILVNLDMILRSPE